MHGLKLGKQRSVARGFARGYAQEQQNAKKL